MPLSSVIGADTIIKPGVCTSTTRPASPYDGQVIYETDTDRCLVWNNTGWVQLSTGTANPPGLELVKTQTIGTAVSSVTVSDAFSSTYDNYFLTISGGAGSQSSGGTLTLGSTATGYYWGAQWVSYTGSTGAFNGNNIGAVQECFYISTNALNFQMIIKNPNLAKNTLFNWQVSGAQTSSVHLAVHGGGYLADTTQYTAFTLTVSAGTMTGGTVYVYGYRK